MRSGPARVQNQTEHHILKPVRSFDRTATPHFAIREISLTSETVPCRVSNLNGAD